MAHFRGSVKGSRGAATRLGGAERGLTVVANGWNFGVTVHLRQIGGKDVAEIQLTSGSGYSGKNNYLGTFSESDLK